MKNEWKATHRIIVREGPAKESTWLVMLDDGKFFSEGRHCEWVLDPDGKPKYIAGGAWNPHARRAAKVILEELPALPAYVADPADEFDPRVIAIHEVAEKIRRAIDRTIYPDQNHFMRGFPHRCCHHACKILAMYFYDHTDLGIFEIVDGEFNEEPHQWLERDGVIVDISADQFGDLPTAIVTRNSNWHAAFKRKPNDAPVDAEMLDRFRRSEFYLDIYPAIVAEIK
jgi:hypothetical protein